MSVARSLFFWGAFSEGLHLEGGLAPGDESTGVAMGLAGCADVAPVEDKPMVGLGDEPFGDVADELLFGG